MFLNNYDVNKSIIFRYERSFESAQPSIGLFKMRDGSCQMVVQQRYGYEPITEGLCNTIIIEHDSVNYFIHRKTLDFSTKEFDLLYKTIVESLYEFKDVEHQGGFDGDDLSVDVKEHGGHACRLRIWCPHYYHKEYHFTDAYNGFLDVLEKAGLLDWYMEWYNKG